MGMMPGIREEMSAGDRRSDGKIVFRTTDDADPLPRRVVSWRREVPRGGRQGDRTPIDAVSLPPRRAATHDGEAR
jgi:hypothetical protein